MGAWGTGIYENDDAADWVGELAASGASAIASSLAAALGDDFVEADVGARALAAADVLGRLRVGDVSAVGSPAMVAWVTAHPADPSAGLLGIAERAVDRVLSAQSELAELWADTDDEGEWRRSVQRVVGRLI